MEVTPLRTGVGVRLRENHGTRTGWSDVETVGHGNGASVAQEPKPGREETHQPEPN